ncbi:MAG: VCBS repeat-containing protein, partial [Myxococcales bacterium]|nr:VCBS repeat-containing protein [Myxococcales bacterium]
DGRSDVVVANDTLGTLSLFWNQGAGSLQAATPPISTNCRPRALALADA